MKRRFRPIRAPQGDCLDYEDFYAFVTRADAPRSQSDLETHLADCAACREELAQLLKILHPDGDEALDPVPSPSQSEIDATLKLIQTVSQDTPTGAYSLRRVARWTAAAAAALLIVALSSLAWQSVVEGKKSRAFFAEGKSVLRENYQPQTASGLRVELPYPPGAGERTSPNPEALDTAERLFYQALAVREGMSEARLGLGFVLLARGKFSEARDAFQKQVDAGQLQPRVLLGRGAASFEIAMTTQDPSERATALAGALEDFETILSGDPSHLEARYNVARTLFELGRHEEALKEIGSYFARDSTSIWSKRLRKLETRIRANRSEIIDEEVDRAAAERDPERLRFLAEVVPYAIPSAVSGAMIRSLQAEDAPADRKDEELSSLQWAGKVMATAYRSVTGDDSYVRLMEFYAGLSPPARKTKKDLDAAFQSAYVLQMQGDLEAALSRTAPLQKKYQSLRDHWQLVNLHHLRGNCLYFGRADFPGAIGEYHRMLRAAEAAGAPDLIARSLGALASLYVKTRRFDEALSCLQRMKDLAWSHKLDPWVAFASQYLGSFYLRLNRLEESLREYSSALAIACRLNNEQLMVVTLDNVGEVLERSGRLQEARKFYVAARQAQERFDSTGSTRAEPAVRVDRLNLLSKQGYLALRTNDLEEAEKHFELALQSPLSGLAELEARLRTGLSRAHMADGRMADAEMQVKIALDLTSTGQFPEIEWQTEHLAALLRKQSGDVLAALAHLERATAVLERMRRGIPSHDLKSRFLIDRFEPYEEIVSLLYQSQEDKARAIEYVDRYKSMTLRESLGMSDDLLSSGIGETRELTSGGPQSDLPRGLIVLEYFFSSDELFIFVSVAGKLRAVRLPILKHDLERQVSEFLQSIRSRNSAVVESLSRSLYNRLVRPAFSLLESTDIGTLAILPDGPLHILPFAALKDDEGRYLVQVHPLVYAPSRTILRHCLSMARTNADLRTRSILLLDGTSNLRGASAELEHLTKLFGARARLAGPQDLKSVAAMAAGSEIIHFAGHAASVNGSSKLVFAATPQPVFLNSEMISRWKLQRNFLVSLAGCNTGVGPRSDGEIPWGLVPAFLNAGAPAILLSLLPVDDAATEKLTSRFYDLLAQGIHSKARALQLAQVSILEESLAGADATPLTWTPFVLVGDPR